MAKRRIKWIDFVRGLSMVYIVSLHTGGFFNFQGAYITFMSVFFLLSGLLFDGDKSTKELFISKINGLLIPFVLYYLIGCAIYYLLNFVFPDYISYSISRDEVERSNGLLDVFVRRQYFNGPIWFILCLFRCETYFILIVKFLKSYLQPIVISCVGAIGWLLGSQDVFIPMMLDVGMTVLPVFYCGFLLRKMNFCTKQVGVYSLVLFLFSTLMTTLIIYFINPGIHLHYNHPHSDPLLVLVLSVVSSYTILQFAKMLFYFAEKMAGVRVDIFPILQYIGRNSLIVLGFHHLVYRPLVVLGIPTGNVLFIVTLLVNLALIPLVNRFVPILGGKTKVLR